jgi:hypothetical protein
MTGDTRRCRHGAIAHDAFNHRVAKDDWGAIGSNEINLSGHQAVVLPNRSEIGIGDPSFGIELVLNDVIKHGPITPDLFVDQSGSRNPSYGGIARRGGLDIDGVTMSADQ